jgi:hypothetical protein
LPERIRARFLTPIPQESSGISRIFVTLLLWTMFANASILRLHG